MLKIVPCLRKYTKYKYSVTISGFYNYFLLNYDKINISKTITLSLLFPIIKKFTSTTK